MGQPLWCGSSPAPRGHLQCGGLAVGERLGVLQLHVGPIGVLPDVLHGDGDGDVLSGTHHQLLQPMGRQHWVWGGEVGCPARGEATGETYP